jgi:chemotaxis methyl-accepting protein methylase
MPSTGAQGLYPDNIAADVSAERLARYFVAEEGGGYRISKDIREMVVFARRTSPDPPFTKLDILSCRNLLIYFGAQLQKNLLPLFYYALNRDGLLLLGSAETIGNFGHLFAAGQQQGAHLPPPRPGLARGRAGVSRPSGQRGFAAGGSGPCRAHETASACSPTS